MTSSSPLDHRTILIVDDAIQNLTVLTELLQPLYRVRAVNSGERALRAANSPPKPDLILLDVMMPGMDGYVTLQRLRAAPETCDIPVIFLTAMDSPENEERGLSLGAVDYITKPINPAIVLARVRTHLELKRARDILVAEAEQQRWQLQKMDSLGALAGGIAHDINNLLVPIMGMTESVLEKLPADSPLLERLEMVVDASRQIKELVDRILSFSRMQGIQHTPLDIAEVVRDAIPLLRTTTQAGMTIVEQIDDAIGLVAGDITQLQAVMMNLASNAAYAMHGRGGELVISLRRITADDRMAKSEAGLIEGRCYAHLRFADTGCGMDARTLKKVFDPFFTTREVGKGTGLGMAIVQRIVKSHDGAILVTSVPGQGTTFDMFFPIITPGRR